MFQGYALRNAGGWSGDFLVADGEDLEKNIASDVHVKSFKSQEGQVTTVQGMFVFPCADGSLEQEGHVVSRPPRHHQLQKEEDYKAEGNSDASFVELEAPDDGTSSRACPVITSTVISLHLAVSCMFHKRHRCRLL